MYLLPRIMATIVRLTIVVQAANLTITESLPVKPCFQEVLFTAGIAFQSPYTSTGKVLTIIAHAGLCFF